MPHFLRLHLGTMSQVDKDIRKVLGVSRGMDAKGYVAYYPSYLGLSVNRFLDSRGLVIQWGQGLNMGKLWD